MDHHTILDGASGSHASSVVLAIPVFAGVVHGLSQSPALALGVAIVAGVALVAVRRALREDAADDEEAYST